MKELIARYWVDGPPIAQPRPRSQVIRDPRRRGGVRVRTYTPSNGVKQWKEAVAIETRRTGSKPTSKAISIRLGFRFAFPPSISKAEAAYRAGRIHTFDPDVDNLIKPILDAITRAGNVWIDDNQVGEVEAFKKWIDPGEVAGVLIEIFEFEEPEGVTADRIEKTGFAL